MHGVFPEIYIPVVFDNCVFETKVDNSSVELSIHDTAVQIDFDNLRPLSYRQSDVILVAFDLSNVESLNSVPTKWREEVHKHCAGLPIILVGCKKDEWKHPVDGAITLEQIELARKALGAVVYTDCSAKNGDGVKRVFETAAAYSAGFQK
ncbi:hypothetical protein NLG97_g4374 [Lecanicillium saksenae]|uniref:Uncharacterized protein n=1 Tax=Lecanicillium saksenae TaxID=468837 RepID=A0ACC1QVG2_9HYPO|nr:hypothetical protein NLG97_g4374 [Lecanicillium saksenae]